MLLIVLLDLVLQNLGTLHEKDLIEGHKGHDLGQENDDGTTLERDHATTKTEDTVHLAETDQVQENDEETGLVREDVVDQGKENIDIAVDHLDANTVNSKMIYYT